VNREAIRRIAEAVPVPVQLGGGVRDISVLKAYMDLGIKYVIIGTAAYKNPFFVKEACGLFPGRIILGVDARSGKVSVEGWTEDVALTPVELVDRFAGLDLSAIVYTDISRDGMRIGPNIEGTAAFARSVPFPVIASGGISGLTDVLALANVSDSGITGAITGRALYDGALDFRAALSALKNLKLK
ncbi:MAG: 1-(5-phosphoribosyl)-5-((5-phosphoribosylamino)methylideneamino)imidazole-4-carboxamide isomerase, partial [Desulfobacteraceae bacterium]